MDELLELVKPTHYEPIAGDCAYIRKIYQFHGVRVTPSSWLWNMLGMMEKVGQGKWVKVPSEEIQKVKWDLTSQIVMIRSLARDLETCVEHEIPIKRKLEQAYENYRMADSILHEIHDLACILRSGLTANFIDPVPEIQTPDIEVNGTGVLECKVLKSPRELKRRLSQAAKQLTGYPGEKVVNFMIYFLRPQNIDFYLETLTREAYSATKRIYEDSGSLNGVTLSFLVPSEVGNVQRVEYQTTGFAIKSSKEVIQIIEALRRNCLEK